MSTRPARFEPLLFTVPLSGGIAVLVSGVATWHSSWQMTFPSVVVVAFVVRKRAARCVRSKA